MKLKPEILAVCIAAMIPCGVHAQPSQGKVVRIVNPFAAGGNTDIVTRAISGHATEAMQRHYSTVSESEMRSGLAKVISLATERARRAA